MRSGTLVDEDGGGMVKLGRTCKTIGKIINYANFALKMIAEGNLKTLLLT